MVDADGDQGTLSLPKFKSKDSWMTNVHIEKKLHIGSRHIVQAGLLLLEQFCNYISLLFYMFIVTDPNISAYWSKSSLYCGLWDKHFMSQSQYEQMNC